MNKIAIAGTTAGNLPNLPRPRPDAARLRNRSRRRRTKDERYAGISLSL